MGHVLRFYLFYATLVFAVSALGWPNQRAYVKFKHMLKQDHTIQRRSCQRVPGGALT